MLKVWFQKIDKILFLWLGCFVVNSITFIFIRYKIHPGNRVLALHYNVVVGVDWYGPGKNLYTIPLIAFVITLTNMILARALASKYLFLSFMAGVMSLIIQLILFAAVLFLLVVN